MNAPQRVPSSFRVRSDFDALRELAYGMMDSDAERKRESRYAADNYTAGVAEGWRQARGWVARATGLVLLFGTCFGVVLAVVAGGWLA